MEIKNFEILGDQMQIDFDDDGEPRSKTIPMSDRWTYFRNWGLSSVLRGGSYKDMIGTIVPYKEVFDDDNEAFTLTDAMISKATYKKILDAFGDIDPNHKSFVQGINEFDKDDKGEMIYKVWGYPHGTAKYWIAIAKKIQREYPNKFLGAVKIENYDWLVQLLENLKLQHEVKL